MTTTQIEDAVRTFCVMASTDQVRADADLGCKLFDDGDIRWSATFFGREAGVADTGLTTCGDLRKSPGDALVVAYQKYRDRLANYAPEAVRNYAPEAVRQAEEVPE